ncbi:MAG: hypothetical protein K6U80_19600 [Firmicutes bacterium]|nr:hypothetical protein [Bacillota bacterium]
MRWTAEDWPECDTAGKTTGLSFLLQFGFPGWSAGLFALTLYRAGCLDLTTLNQDWPGLLCSGVELARKIDPGFTMRHPKRKPESLFDPDVLALSLI